MSLHKKNAASSIKSIRIPNDAIDAIELAAAEQNRTVNGMYCHAILEWLGNNGYIKTTKTRINDQEENG